MLRDRGAGFTEAELAGKFSGYTESRTAASYLIKSLADLIQVAGDVAPTAPVVR